MTKSLSAIIIRQPMLTNTFGELSRVGGRVRFTNENAKAIAMQMPRAELVRMSADAQHLDAIAFELWQPCFDAGRHRHHLPGHGASILEPRGADFADGHIETASDLPGKILGAHIAF